MYSPYHTHTHEVSWTVWRTHMTAPNSASQGDLWQLPFSSKTTVGYHCLDQTYLCSCSGPLGHYNIWSASPFLPLLSLGKTTPIGWVLHTPYAILGSKYIMDNSVFCHFSLRWLITVVDLAPVLWWDRWWLAGIDFLLEVLVKVPQWAVNCLNFPTKHF